MSVFAADILLSIIYNTTMTEVCYSIGYIMLCYIENHAILKGCITQDCVL